MHFNRLAKCTLPGGSNRLAVALNYLGIQEDKSIAPMFVELFNDCKLNCGEKTVKWRAVLMIISMQEPMKYLQQMKQGYLLN